MSDQIAGKLELGDGTVIDATVSAVGEQGEFREPGQPIDRDRTCGQCGLILDDETVTLTECPSCRAIWPSVDV
jgi:hypothetical protein